MTPINTGTQRHLMAVDDLSKEEIFSLFHHSQKMKSDFLSSGAFPSSLKGCQVALLFSEASTRTRVSFQMAVDRLGGKSLLVEAGASSSLSKGESVEDTFKTLHAYNPDMIVVRCGGDGGMDKLAQFSKVPVVNGGFGEKSHPTQALLDFLTLQENGLPFEGLRSLYVGDLRHSRVFASHLRMAKKLGVQVGVCSPPEFLPRDLDGLEFFENLDEAMGWTQVYCGLRIQFERHQKDLNLSLDDYRARFALTPSRLKLLAPTGKILHPGPVNWGVEFDSAVGKDPRLLMWEQMENSVYLRAALMNFLGNGVTK